METFWQDLKFGLRSFARQPGFAAVVTLILALGIGANTAVFNYVYSLLLARLPVPEAERVVRVFGSSPQAGRTDVFSYPDYVDLRDRNRSFQALAVRRDANVSLSTVGNAENAYGELVSGNYFAVMGIPAVLGRALTPEDDVAPGSYARVVISYGLWQRRFGGSSDAVGRTLHLNGYPYTIVGVMPAGFLGSHPVAPADFWIPVMMYQQIRTGHARKQDIYNRGWGWLSAAGRLKKGVTLAQAEEDLRRLSREMEKENPDQNRDVTFVLYPARALPEEMQRGASGMLGFCLAVTGVLLLVVCANIAAMLLARSVLRNREVAIRLALGAGRARLVRQWLTESVLYAVPGGVAGVLVSMWTTEALANLVPRQLAGFSPEVHMDAQVLGFAAAVTVLTGILVGLVPALRASRADLTNSLKEGGAAAGARHAGRMHSIFVVAQSAACLTLLVVAGLLLRSLHNSNTFQPGFRTENLLLTALDLERHGYDARRARIFYEELRERLRALPGVENATYATTVPLGFGQDSMGIQIAGQTPPPGRSTFSIPYNVVGPEYFSTMGIPLVAGRAFNERDLAPGAQPVVVINSTMAHRFWPDENPVGKSVRDGTAGPFLEIIGVARDISYYSLGEAPRPFLYRAAGGAFEDSLIVHVRARGDAAALAPAVRKEVEALDASVAAQGTMTFTEMRSLALLPSHAMATVAGLFGALVLVLTALGLYGLVSYSVSRRTREIGIRMALGARPADVLQLELRRGMTQAFVGLALGLAAAAGAAHLLESKLFGLTPLDPATYIAGSLLLLAVALLACALPARRAARVDPMVALRYE